MDSIQTLLDRLAIYLAAYKHYIDIKSQARLLDGAILGEALAKDLAEIAFGYQGLCNLNVKKSYPAIDLGCKDSGCAIQVTITANSTKVIETQEKFFEHNLDKTYQKLKFICLREKQREYDSKKIVRQRGNFTFDPSEDIYELTDLFIKLVNNPDKEKIESFCKRLELELGSAIRPYLHGADRPGHNLQQLFSQHDCTPGSVVAALSDFNVNRSMLNNNMLLAEAATSDMICYVAEQFMVSNNWLEGIHSHIYSECTDLEKGAFWRRSLRGAWGLFEKARKDGETLQLIIPITSGECFLDNRGCILDDNDPCYEHFFLVARKQNNFKVNRYRLVLSEALKFPSAQEGILLLFLAATLYEFQKKQRQNNSYLDVIGGNHEHIIGCDFGSKFIVECYEDSRTLGNNMDFFYIDENNKLFATKYVPCHYEKFLQEELTVFVNALNISLPNLIHFIR